MKGFTKYLRKNQTDAERVLWRHLRNRQLAGCKSRRQVALGDYIVDFVCFEAALIVEVDGGQHLERQEEDESRTAWLRSQGFSILRFWNDEVLNQTQAILEAIYSHLILAPSPQPSPAGGEGD